METVLKHRFEQAINHYEVRPGFGFASNPLGDREGGMWLRECDELPIIVVVLLEVRSSRFKNASIVLSNVAG
jgi:hypothetical protein